MDARRSLQQDVERAAEAATRFSGGDSAGVDASPSREVVRLERRRRFAAHGFTRRTVETLESLQASHRPLSR